MNVASGIVVYTIVWWVVIFCVLPIGVKSAAESHRGHDSGAPVNPRMGFKIILTTIISTVVFLCIYAIIVSDLISFREP